jgi:hypothetical protein
LKGAIAAVLLVLVVVAVGCGGSGKAQGPVYAGMDREAARQAALVESQSETTDGSNELYGHHLRLLSLKPGHDPSGTAAWRATFADLTQGGGSRLCIWMADNQYSGGLTLQPCPRS